jgi:Arc/MetJ-type ribon-helix-helix transcriptional regulator
MKTTTIRLNDELALLLDELAETDDSSASALIRTAISEYIGKRAAEDEEFGKRVKAIAQKKLGDRVAELRDTFGPDSLPDLNLIANDR